MKAFNIALLLVGCALIQNIAFAATPEEACRGFSAGDVCVASPSNNSDVVFQGKCRPFCGALACQEVVFN